MHEILTVCSLCLISKGTSYLGKFLGAADSTYTSMFLDSTWKDTFEKTDNQRPGNDTNLGKNYHSY